ncbi:hypothetical protein NC653_001034 [Populus alba x Populus x berolinensis]|uniref:Uncharacterized protein n=1 Tax=Populus alba x Populus x berolinensis TaxID=444605 RepID=A0AAD6WF16_9ROSI|nr:hypothetical protein NC653_001034 [Populus alba x Populus x berolinensis]
MGKSMVVVSDFASYCHVNRLSCKDYYKKSDAMLSNSQSYGNRKPTTGYPYKRRLVRGLFVYQTVLDHVSSKGHSQG